MTITIETYQIILALYLLIDIFVFYKTGIYREVGWHLVFYTSVTLIFGPIIFVLGFIKYVLIDEWY